MEIRYDSKSLIRNGKRFFLHSGEFHYFRTAREQWKDSLKKVKAANLNAISIYVPWNWHEIREGEMDFTGKTHPQRNIVEFLKMAADMKIDLILRPGPYICSEWLNGGIPPWLLEKHPEILALDVRGEPSMNILNWYPPITYSHPTYLRYCKKWLHEILELAKPYLCTRGGNIINVQLDDEQSYWRGLAEGATVLDFNPIITGSGKDKGRFAAWLEQKYSSVDALNGQQGTAYKDFGQIKPPQKECTHYKELPQYLDWYYFRLSEVDEYIGALYDMVRAEGVDTSISTLAHYLFSPMAWSKFVRFLKRTGRDIINTNQYYSAPLFEISDMREDKLGSIAACNEVYKAGMKGSGTPPMLMEVQSAMSAHITGPEMEELYRLLLAQGIHGYNYYMIAGGENHPDYVLSNGRSYDISAPIGAKGELRDHYYAIQDLGRTLKQFGQDIVGCDTLYDLTVGFYEPYEAAANQMDTLKIGFRDNYAHVTREYFGYFACAPRGFDLFSLLTHSGVTFNMANLEEATFEELRQIKLLWVLGLDFMAEAVQKKLADYVSAGGTLVIFPRVPLLDDAMRPCTILADVIGCRPIDPKNGKAPGEKPDFRAIDFDDRKGVLMFDTIDRFDPPADAEVIATERKSGKPSVMSRRYGQGKMILVGFKLKYVYDAHGDHKAFVRRILAEAGIERYAYSHNDEIVVKEKSNGELGFLTVVNPNNVRNTARIHYTDPKTGKQQTLPQLLKGVSYMRQGGTIMPLNIPIPALKGRIMYSTAEIQSIKTSGKNIEIEVKETKSAMAELALETALPVKVKVNGKLLKITADKKTGIKYVTYPLCEDVVKVILAV